MKSESKQAKLLMQLQMGLQDSRRRIPKLAMGMCTWGLKLGILRYQFSDKPQLVGAFQFVVLGPSFAPRSDRIEDRRCKCCSPSHPVRCGNNTSQATNLNCKPISGLFQGQTSVGRTENCLNTKLRWLLDTVAQSATLWEWPSAETWSIPVGFRNGAEAWGPWRKGP